MSEKENDPLFSLLVNISSSSESTLERLSNSLKVFVKKFFDSKDFTKPNNPTEMVLNSIMRIEAILYTVYELEPLADSEPKKLELLYYKDMVLKSLVVLTNLDFFIKTLKEHHLFKDAHELREKVSLEFKIESSKHNREDTESSSLDIIGSNSRFFKDIRPTDHRKVKIKGQLGKPLLPEEQLLEDIKNKNLSALGNLKRMVKSTVKAPEAKINSDGKKIIRTAMGWQIPSDFFDNPLYSD